jgi:hypothetical protein
MRALPGRRTPWLLASIAFVGGSLALVSGLRPFAWFDGSIVEPTGRTLNTPGKLRPTNADARPGGLTPAAAKLLFALAHRTSDASNANDLFAPKSWYVAPPSPPPAEPVAPAAPTAPPFPYAFVGSYTEGQQATVYFLTRGDRVYDVKPGDTLDGIYSVDGVESGSLVFTYKPLAIRQTLAVGGAQ